MLLLFLHSIFPYQTQTFSPHYTLECELLLTETSSIEGHIDVSPNNKHNKLYLAMQLSLKEALDYVLTIC